jgi:hypothetical protein
MTKSNVIFKIEVGCDGIYLQSQYLGGRGRNVMSLRLTWAPSKILFQTNKTYKYIKKEKKLLWYLLNVSGAYIP